jgi:hypothetical protein
MSVWKRLESPQQFEELPELTIVRYWDTPKNIIGTRVKDDYDRTRLIFKKNGRNTICNLHGDHRSSVVSGWKVFEYLSEDPEDEEAFRIAESLLS